MRAPYNTGEAPVGPGADPWSEGQGRSPLLLKVKAFRNLAERCNCILQFGYCHNMLSVVCHRLTQEYREKTTANRITRFSLISKQLPQIRGQSKGGRRGTAFSHSYLVCIVPPTWSHNTVKIADI